MKKRTRNVFDLNNKNPFDLETYFKQQIDYFPGEYCVCAPQWDPKEQ